MNGALTRSVCVRRVLSIVAAACLLAGCASASSGGAGPHRTTVSAASCAGLPPAAQFAAARTVLRGTFRPGPSAAVNGVQVLASPAGLTVSRYLKGHGPALVQVQTAVASAGGMDRFSSEGITPSAGQTWTIYSSSDRSPLDTSVCAGSAPVGGGAAPGAPRSFMYVTSSGLHTEVQLRSPVTGRVTRRLGSFGQNFTNNGAAVSPDRRYAYVTVVSRHELELVRITAATGRRTVIAHGNQPAISSDGRRLAYAVGWGTGRLAVRGLPSGPDYTIDVSRLLGPSTALLGGSLTWVGDGSRLVIAPGPVAIALSGDRGSASPESGKTGTCSAVPRSATCLIVVTIAADGRPLGARRLTVAGIAGPHVTIAADPLNAQGVLVAAWEGRRTIVDQVVVNGPRARVVPMVTMAPVLPLAIDPVAGQLLYLAGHSPPALWIGALTPGHLIARHQLIANAQADAATW